MPDQQHFNDSKERVAFELMKYITSADPEGTQARTARPMRYYACVYEGCFALVQGQNAAQADSIFQQRLRTQ